MRCMGGRAVGAGRQAGEGSPELLLLRQEGCPAGLWPRNEESPSHGHLGLGEADWAELRQDDDCLEGHTKLSELCGVLSGYDDWVMYNTFAT